MFDLLPFLSVTGKTDEEKISCLANYLARFKEELEFILSNIGTDNLSAELKDELARLKASDETYATQTDVNEQVSTNAMNGANTALTLIDAMDYTDTYTSGYFVTKVDQADGVISVTREEVNPYIEAKINALDYTDSSVSGEFVTEVNETDGVISVTRADVNPYIEAKINALDYSDSAVNGEFVTKVEETDGIISVTRADVNPYIDAKINALDYSDSAVSGQFVTEVSETNGIISVARANVSAYITSIIENLDYSDSAVSGQYVSEVNETDGIISVTRASLPTKLSDFTDDVVSGNYLPLSGGTLTGLLESDVTINNTIMFDHCNINGDSVARLNNYNDTYEILRLGEANTEGILRLQNGSNSNYGQIRIPIVTDKRHYYLPDASGNIALTDDITSAIANLDYTDSAISGQYISEVSETDGVISVTRASLPTKLSDFTDDVVDGVYQKQASTSSVSTTTYTVASETGTNVCTMSLSKGLNIIRVGVSVPNSVTNTDFTMVFSSTINSETVATGAAEHRYIGGVIGSKRTVLDFVYTGYFSSDTTFYANLMHNNASSISLQTFARIINIPT